MVGTSHAWPFRPHLSFRAEREILPDAYGQDFSVASLLRNDKGGNHSVYYKKIINGLSRVSAGEHPVRFFDVAQEETGMEALMPPVPS
jgi:hypothetical protein